MLAVLEHIYQFKDEAALKDTYEDILGLFKLSVQKSFLVEPLKKFVSKSASVYHLQLFIDLLDSESTDMNEVLAVVSPQFKTML